MADRDSSRPTVERVLTSVRMRLDGAVHPTRRELVDFLFAHNQMFVNRMRCSDEGWLLKRFALEPDGSTGTVTVPAADFAGAFLVHTDSDRYSSRRYREVDALRLQDLDLAGASGTAVFAADSEADTLQAVAFFNEAGQWKARVAPVDARGAYTVWYEPGFVGETSLENTPEMLAAFAPLLVIAVSLDALGSARWDGLDDDGNAAKRAALRPRLMQLEADFREDWRRYLESMNQPQIGFRQPFESSPGASRRSGSRGRF